MSATGLTLTVVGGGSSYTPELIDGVLLRRDRLPITSIRLVDPDLARLDIIGNLSTRMVQRAGGGIDVSWGDDLAAAIIGSDFVVSQFRVGGQAARHRDELMGRDFGIIGQETVGVGGFAKALRTVPVALRVARTIEELAPGAVLLNFTNPAGLVTEALRRFVPNVTIVGLCNVPWNIRTEVAEALRVPFAELALDYVGLNHLSWVRGFSVGDADRTNDVLEGLRAQLGKQAAAEDEPDWDSDAIRVMRAIPNYYLLYYYETQAMLRHQSCHPTRASEVMAIEAKLFSMYADPALDHKPAELMERGGAYYSDSAAELMADIHGDTGSIHIVNTRNNGAVPGLDDDIVVELPARITAQGADALPTTAMRPDMDALVRTVKDFELLTIRAAVDGDVDAAHLALLTNPLGPDASDVTKVWRRLVEDNKDFLGSFGDVVALVSGGG